MQRAGDDTLHQSTATQNVVIVIWSGWGGEEWDCTELIEQMVQIKVFSLPVTKFERPKIAMLEL